MMPSEGLTTTWGSASGGRRPGRSSRVKQSCRLLNSLFLASDKSSSENSRQQAIDKSRTSEFSILLNQPMKRVTAARGIRLVNRKLRSSCSVSAEIRPLIVMNLSAALVSAGGMDSPLPILYLSTAAVAGAAAVFPKVKARLALSRAKHRSLSGHSKMSRMVARLVPFYDLTGSYGVNIFGNDFYKECIAEGEKRAHALGPVLGTYHPVVADNVKRLCEISGLDEISFHMSGTEAVMQAVRLARYHTRRTHLVRFCGAYHGWWGDVQPGIGNPLPARETYTLKEMSEDSLRVLRTRRDIACVLVNPLQALHANAQAPSDSSLLDGARGAHFDKAAYVDWLKRLRAVCTEQNIVLIFDEVFVGFRLAKGGAQEYFGVRADLVTYGKTLGGGLR